MLTLKTCAEAAVQAFGAALLDEYRTGLTSFERAAQTVVARIYGEFRQANGDTTFALFRIFRLTQRHELPPDLLLSADPSVNYWVTLAGTVGDKLEWCDRRHSRDHRAIPENKALKAPMLKAVFDQIGLQWGQKVDQTLVTQRTDESQLRYFHVPIAFDSPHIPSQTDFVEPYHIRSVVGLGDRFVSGAAYVALGFSKSPIYAEDARKFVALAPYLSRLLSIYDERGVIWSKP